MKRSPLRCSTLKKQPVRRAKRVVPATTGAWCSAAKYKALVAAVIARDRWTVCRYCLVHLEPHEITLDHVTPRSLGGKNTLNNLVLACRVCNATKGNRPVSWMMEQVKTLRKTRRVTSYL